MRFGAKTNYLIGYKHEWWRLLTPVFIHVNLPHLLINMYSLWVIGPWVEKLYGSARFVVFWVATGLAGVLASYLTVIPWIASRRIEQFPDQESRRSFGRRLGCVVWAWSACSSFLE
jgi:membrane associated rhomboid family serine protease